MKIGIISTTASSKGEGPAYLLYSKSPLFRLSHEYCQKFYDKVFIFSGKLGLIEPQATIKSHNGTMYLAKHKATNKWLKGVARAFKQKIPKESEIYFHTSQKYARLIPYLGKNYKCTEPLKGLRIGQRIKFYKDNLC